MGDAGDEAKDVEAEARKILLWDRKAEGGFPETKVLKQRVRDCIDPGRDLGHSDKGGKKKDQAVQVADVESRAEDKVQTDGQKEEGAATVCEDCK